MTLMIKIGMVLFLLIFSLAAIAQTGKKLPDLSLPVPEWPKQEHRLSESIPHLDFTNPEGIARSLKNFSFPGKQPDPPGYDLLARYPMPVVIPGPEFHSEMPVAVPDSSVHYHIQLKRIELQKLPFVQDLIK